MSITLDFERLTNKYFQPYFYDDNRYLVLWGGAGSGKSHFAAQKIIFRIMMDYGKVKHKFLVIRKTTPSVRDSCFALIKDYLIKWQIPFEAKDLHIKVLGSEILFKGIDDPEKIKSIEGITGIWLEEPTGLIYRDFEQLDLRLRGETGTYKQIMLTFNPVGGKLSWIYKHFFAIDKPNTKLVHSIWKDNEFLDKEYIEKLENIDDETYKKIYSEGQWAELKGAIYNNYVIKSLDVKFIIEQSNKLYAGVDFGFNDPSVFLLIAEHDQDVYIILEIYRSGLTNNEFIGEIKALLNYYNEEVEVDLKQLMIYCEHEPARIKEMAEPRNGLIAMPAIKSVKDGIDEVRRHKIIINDICIHSAEEIPMYSNKVDKDGNVLDEPVKFKDHTCDALRYGVYTENKKGIILYT